MENKTKTAKYYIIRPINDSTCGALQIVEKPLDQLMNNKNDGEYKFHCPISALRELSRMHHAKIVKLNENMIEQTAKVNEILQTSFFEKGEDDD
jgi:hypothetical protein